MSSNVFTVAKLLLGNVISSVESKPSLYLLLSSSFIASCSDFVICNPSETNREKWPVCSWNIASGFAIATIGTPHARESKNPEVFIPIVPIEEFKMQKVSLVALESKDWNFGQTYVPAKDQFNQTLVFAGCGLINKK